MITSRRSFITGLVSFAVAAPAIVRSANIMPVKQMFPPISNEQIVQDILDWYTSNNPVVIDAARDRIFIASAWDPKAGLVSRLIDPDEVYLKPGIKRKIISPSVTIERDDHIVSMPRPEEYSPTGWASRLNRLQAGILRNV